MTTSATASLIFISCMLQFSRSEPILKQANVIFRHGYRSPTTPLDPNTTLWREGYNQLTKGGIQQMFELGQYMRSYYQGFLHSIYINDELRVRSSDFDRTLMSAETFLAGMYPPSESQIWNEDILWQPIPVHTVALEDDILLDMDFTDCPKYDKLLTEAMESDSFREANSSFTDYYVYLKNMSGKTGEMNPYGVWNIYDNLAAEFHIGIPYPSWVSQKDLYMMTDFFIPWQYEINFGGLEKGRLKGGPLITELVSNMNRSRNGTLEPKTRKLFLYPGHDNNIVTTMQITNTFNNKYVSSGSSLHVELYEDNNQFFVMMKLLNDTNLEPYIINITICGGKALCPLDEYIEAVSPYLITKDQWLEECKLDEIIPPSISITLIVATAIVVILLLGILIYVCKCGIGPKKHDSDEEDDPYDALLKASDKNV